MHGPKATGRIWCRTSLILSTGDSRRFRSRPLTAYAVCMIALPAPCAVTRPASGPSEREAGVATMDRRLEDALPPDDEDDGGIIELHFNW